MEEQLLQPVTYGSVIYLSTESNLNSFMFSDGFMDKSVKLKSFESICGVDYYDFSFSLFMVLPFSSIQSFEHQANVIQEWRKKLIDNNDNKLEKRREAIQEMWNKLESEYQFNLGVIQKSYNASICFASSNFMLLHINSLKFLTLYQDDNNNLFLQLTENPDECCFFNFDPSLKLQRGRSDNFVYEDEIVYIACAKKYSGKSPYLSIIQNDTIIGLIDSKENWKVNIYEQPFKESTYMRVGSCVWILSSEMPLFFTCQRPEDPYYQMYLTTKNPNLAKEKKGILYEWYQNDKKDIKEQFLNQPRELLLDGLQILLTLIKTPKIGQSDELSPFGLWKIESNNVKLGGELKWDQTYRLKNIITGCYLSVQGTPSNERLMAYNRANTSSKNADFSCTEFRFVPIDNLIQYKGKTKSIQKISKDAFFMIQHAKTGLWVSLNQNEGIQQPNLLDYVKDINTYRFREASLQQVWETYCVTASQKLLIKFAEYPKSDLERQQFDFLFERVKEMIQFLSEFLTNSQVGNMSLDQEPLQVCRGRQDRFKEQYSLGLLCWLLIEIFPTLDEFELYQINPDDGSKWTLKRRKGHSKIQNTSIKQETEIIKKRYEICQLGYQLLSISATRNQENQQFILKFLTNLSNHIGFGSFVTQSLKQCFRDNKEILEDLHRQKINEVAQNQYQDIFQAMAHRLKQFEPYYKVEILQLLSAFTSQEHQSIYINQEKIFQAIVENKNFLFGHLMRIDYLEDNLLVEYRVFVEREYESKQLKIQEFFQKPQEQQRLNFDNKFIDLRIQQYFLEQLRLYGKLCQNRNYACVKNLQELLPRKALLYYLGIPIDDEIKAILCQLILNLYIDQEPRSIINKPSFVRVLNYSNQSGKDDITDRFIEINLTNDIQGTYLIRKWLLEYLKDKIEYLDDANINEDKTEKIYNELTYEVIRCLSLMVKFGLFSKHANQLLQSTLKLNNQNGNVNDLSNDLKNLVCYLAKLLEYDHNYFQELKTNQIKRSYMEQKEDLKYMINLNIFQKAKVEEEEEEQGTSQKEQDFSQSFPFLKRYTSLFKLIKYFTTKTCKFQKQSKFFILIKKQICGIFQTLLEWREDIQIGKAINWFQTNYMNIEDEKIADEKIADEIMPNFSVDPGKYKNDDENIHPDEEIQDFDYILERPFVEVLILAFYFAQDPDLQNSVVNLLYKRFTQRKKLLLNLKKVSLVQADNNSYKLLSTLVNDIKNQISYSQSWLQIIESNVYDEKAEEALHQTVQKFDQILKEFEQKCDAESFNIKQKIFKHLGGHKLILKFLESGIRVIYSKIKYFHISSEEEKEQINQAITPGMNKAKFLPPLKLEQKKSELGVIENSDQYSYRKQFIQYVIKVFTTCHQILSKFAEGNKSNQNSIYKIYVTLLDKPVRINIGQVAFLKSLYNNNVDLCLKPQDLCFDYVQHLINDHGHQYEFLEVILVFLKASKETDTQKIQVAIMSKILSNYNYFDPTKTIIPKRDLPLFYEDKNQEERQLMFRKKFIQLVSGCIESEISVNFIVQLQENLSVRQLLQMLLHDTKSSTGSLLMKEQIFSILKIYFEKIDKALQDFQKCCTEFTKLLQTVSQKMQQPSISKDDQSFIALQIVKLVNVYFMNFLKDIGMISLKMLAQDQSIQKEKFIFQFAQQLVNALHKFDKLPIYKAGFMELSNNFSLEIAEDYFQQPENIFQEIQNNKNNNQPLIVQEQDSEQLEKSSSYQSWNNFIKKIIRSHSVKKAVLSERIKFKEVILNVQDIFEKPKETMDIRLKDLIISRDDIIVKLLNYIEHWKVRNASRHTVIFIIKSIRALLEIKNEKQLIKMQIHLDSLKATQIALRLYWSDKVTEDLYIYQLIKWIISLLEGGNKVIQMSILNLLKNNSDSEAFFLKIYTILTEYMASMRKIRKKDDQKKIRKRKFIAKTLQVIQLLCEGHNNDLQNYLRQQTNSKVSYDIVSLMVKLVISNRISDATYESLVQCLDTLTEVVQGPCKENQVVIVTSKFVSWSVDLLKEDLKLFEQNKIDIQQVKLKRLKLKCTNTLLSLMELQEDNDEIMNLLIRSIPITVLVNELAKFYMLYTSIFKKEYVVECFKTYQDESEGYELKKKNECIIEYGFNLFIIINILMLKNKKSQEADLEEIRKLIDEYQYVNKKSNQGLEGLLDLKINLDLNIKINLPFGQVEDEESNELKKAQEMKKAQKDAYKFFSENTVFIEIARDDQLHRIYFPLLPQCKMLSKESRTDFCEQVDHSSIRDKLVYLMTSADQMRKVMEHEELLRNLFKRLKVVELIATHKLLWEQLAFITNVIINLVILCSYGSYAYTDTLPTPFPISFNGIKFSLDWVLQNQQYYDSTQPDSDLLWEARLNQPRLFYVSDFTWTNTLIVILGYLNLGFSLLVITFFAIKKAPLLITDMWVEFLSKPMGCIERTIMSIVMIVRSFINCLVDFDFAYFCGYMACIIVGLIIHPFAFVLLLADFLRISTLKIVIKAIWISKIQMGLSFLVFLLVEYYFAVIGYLFFWDQYQDQSCQIMWRCFLQTFDQTFKNGGAIGDYLTDTQLQSPSGSQLPINYSLTPYQQDRFIYRFVFDVLFKFILVFLIINMVAGIIIDTFGALKDEMLEKQSNLEDYCFICGIQSEKLDKSTQYGHYSHIKKNHHMWNYVYYKVYLFFKPKNDLSGNETYVKRLMINNEIDWFPVKKAIGFTDEDEEDEEQNEDNLQIIEETYQEVQELEQLALSTNQKLKIFI
ncbi:unnamed protein product [Paramecium pentaurelia]|uniref:Uncharacterized protein n=1 Tax=Paramecium pentaurelia TaxID=43138 RepID=A0A8S1U7F4_9CILI|nr:unnamed protein product [Paramecium pentaurelia]